ncbi:uncharacterized protein LOC17900837 [Capsella rubella]|uniref:uncharacterized protein LOC17900837 n=1 Tax=Capsella rubella TaxID=81985 RepID=UPI000CD4C4ED|nr:uncharacterized protein LOC17900837 [Capsella rubella]
MDQKALDQCPPLTKLAALKHKFLQQDDLRSYERPKRKISSPPRDDDPSSKRLRIKFRRGREDGECENDTVLDESPPPRLKSSEPSIRQRSTGDEDHQENEFTSDAVFYKPWLDHLRLKRLRLGDGEDPPSSSSSPSVDDIAALTLIQFSRDKRQTKPQTLIPQPQTPTLIPQPQTQRLKPQPQTLKPQSQPQPHTETETTEPQGTTCDLFECSVCGKGFTSYQALGGHKASHRVKPPQPLVENAGEKTREKLLAPSGKIHKCSICHVLFPTGQALGGHKRRHYEGVLGGHKHEVVLKLSPNQEQSLSVSDNVVNGLNQEEVVPSSDKCSLSDASTGKKWLDLELSLRKSEGVVDADHRPSQEEVAVEENKWSPSSNGSGVTNVSDPEQSQRRLIDLNIPLSPESDESGSGEVEEVESTAKYKTRRGMALLTQLKHILTKVNQVSPSMPVSVLKKQLEFAMQDYEDGLQVDDNVVIQNLLEKIERNFSTTCDQDTYSERFIKALEQIRREEDDAALVETGYESSQHSQGVDEDSFSQHRFLEGLGQKEEEGFGYGAVSTKTGLESSVQSQRQRSGDDGDCFSEQSSSFVETNGRGEKKLGGYAENDAFIELLLENIVQSRLQQRLSSSDDDVKAPSSSSSSSLSEVEIATRSHKKEPQKQPKPKPQMLPKSDAYKCSVCGKEFTSFQALGGHKATSHRVKPLLNDSGEKTGPKTLAPSGKIHQCSVCHKLFPTGPSLGGHKRLHYQGDKLSPSGNADVATNVSDPKQSLEGLVDVNEVPSRGDLVEVKSAKIKFFNFI